MAMVTTAVAMAALGTCHSMERQTTPRTNPGMENPNPPTHRVMTLPMARMAIAEPSSAPQGIRDSLNTPGMLLSS